MNKNMIIALVVAVLAIGGGAAAFIASNDSDDDSNTSNTSTPTNTSNTQQQSNTSNTANPLGLDTSSLLQGPYSIVLNTTDADGRTTQVTAEVDADGDVSTTITDQGQTSSFILADGDTYFQEPGTTEWLKFPAGTDENVAPVNIDELELGFSEDDLDDLNDFSIADRGTGPCTAGTCRIYETTDPATSETGTIKVDTATNRLSEVDITSANGEVVSMVYDYSSNVDVQAPANYTEFEIPSLEDFDLDSLPTAP